MPTYVKCSFWLYQELPSLVLVLMLYIYLFTVRKMVRYQCWICVKEDTFGKWYSMTIY